MESADKQNSLIQRYLSFIIHHPQWALALTVVITLLLGWFLPRLSFKTTVYDLVIEDLPETRQYKEFQETFGSDEIIRIVVRADNILDPLTFAKVVQISDHASQISGVRRVLSLPEIKKAVDLNNEWDSTKFAEMLMPVQLFQRNFLSTDRRTTIITLVLDVDADKTLIIDAVNRLIEIDGQGLRLYQIGMPLVSEALADYSRKDFLHLTPITILIISILLIVLFRNPHCLFLPLACVILSIVWTFGLMALAGISVSMLTIIVPVFLIAVGTAYCMHICSEYLVQAGKNSSAILVCQATFGQMTLPVSLAVMTTIFGIGSLVVNRIAAIQEFAVFACFGMFSLLVIILVFFPAVMALLPLPAARARRSLFLDKFIDRLLNLIVTLNLKYQRSCWIFIGLVSVVSLVGVFFIRVETNPVSFFKRNTPVSLNFHDIYKDMSGSFPINVVMAAKTEDFFEDPSNVAVIERMQEFLGKLPGVDKTVSFADYLKLVNYVSNRYEAGYYALPQDQYEMRMLINTFKSLLGNDMFQRFMSSDYSRVNILLFTHIASSRDFLETKAKILSHVKNEFSKELQWEVTGLGTVIAASSQLLTIGQVKSLGISLFLIFLVMIALFLSSKVGLIAIVPNLFPILVNFGIMGLLGIPLSMATGLIASVAIGLAVDDTIHYLVRYNSEFKKDLDKDRAMRETVMGVGRPIIFTSCTIGLGFAVLIFSHFQPTAIFGFLMVITMVSALVGDLIVLPSLMLHVELVTAWDLLKIIPTAGGISPGMVHEINQPLNAIKVGSDFLKMMLKPGASAQNKDLVAVAKEIGEQVDRASQMIQRLSEVGKLPGPEKEMVQIDEPIASSLAILENQLRLDNVQLNLELGENVQRIYGHHNRLVQVIYNLLNNAWEAINAAKAHGDDEAAHHISISTFQKKDRVFVTITDSGIGIPEYLQDRVFEPFFTTKAMGKGKGLGLSISNEIVRDYGGRISINSTIGQGTTVTLSFPAVVG